MGARTPGIASAFLRVPTISMHLPPPRERLVKVETWPNKRDKSHVNALAALMVLTHVISHMNCAGWV